MPRRPDRERMAEILVIQRAARWVLLALAALLLGACASASRPDPNVPVRDYQWSTGVLSTGTVLRLPAVPWRRENAEEIPIVAVLVYDPADPGRNLPDVFWFFQMPDGRCQRWLIADDHLYYAVTRELRLGPTEAPQEVQLARGQQVRQVVQRVTAAPGLRQVKLCDRQNHNELRLNVVSSEPKGWEGARDFVLLGVQGDGANDPAVRARTLEQVRKTNGAAVGAQLFVFEPAAD